ncbi:agmatinase [Candidatus Woesearchaeota archaeon]|nr:agmatinase [Candidatus Woesearchaeota archaeon]
MKFMNLPDEYCTKKSRFAVLPIPYEKDPTYGAGAANGPKAIIDASHHLEYYDERFDAEPFTDGILTLQALNILNKTPEEAMNLIAQEIVVLAKQQEFIISLGGDHAVTIGIAKGLDLIDKDYGIIIFDAHSDLRFSWNNSQFNHACTARKVSQDHKTIVVGVRSMDVDDKDFIKESNNVKIIKSHENIKTKLEEELKRLPEKVYISIDIDVIDHSLIRNTGTPEPGGLFWNEMIELLEIVFKQKKVISADITEFAPQGNLENFRAEAYALAKLAHTLFALKKAF